MTQTQLNELMELIEKKNDLIAKMKSQINSLQCDLKNTQEAAQTASRESEQLAQNAVDAFTKDLRC